MKGDIVFIRAASNRPFVRRVWSETETTVYICNEERYHKLMQNYESELPPVGFPIDDVFCYEQSIEDELLTTYQSNPSIWKRLRPYKEQRVARR